MQLANSLARRRATMPYKVLIPPTFRKLLGKYPRQITNRIRFQLAQVAQVSENQCPAGLSIRAGELDVIAHSIPGGYWIFYEVDEVARTVALVATAKVSEKIALRMDRLRVQDARRGPLREGRASPFAGARHGILD
jgi:mRNA-degrading endonuclease RelE of RelBE toxin-antitoxin system